MLKKNYLTFGGRCSICIPRFKFKFGSQLSLVDETSTFYSYSTGNSLRSKFIDKSKTITALLYFSLMNQFKEQLQILIHWRIILVFSLGHKFKIPLFAQ